MIKRGFTLAEVLITLGIIGVIAAITIPNVINKVNMKHYETMFKKQYSNIQNALNYILIDENVSNCYVAFPEGTVGGYITKGSDCSALNQLLTEKLNLEKAAYKASELYASKSTVLNNGGQAINKNFNYDNWIYYSTGYITKDGCLIFLYSYIVIIDVNGEKGPNKWGYDVFYMHFSKISGRLLLTDNLASLIEKGGRFPRSILQNSDKNTDTSWRRL